MSDPAGELRRIETTDPDGWGTLTTVVAGAYFLNPEIAEQVGYPGRRAIPVDRRSGPRLAPGRAARLGQVARPGLPPDAGGLSPGARAARG